MEIIKYSNGPEGTANPSTQRQTTIQPPDNGTYERTLLIGAISKSLGYDGLHGPVPQTLDGTEYTFDYYHQESDRLIKVFKGFDARASRLYADHPAQPILIFEGRDIPCKMDICECGCGSVLIVDKTVAKHLYDNPSALIHVEGNLWEYSAHVDGKWIWKKQVPFLIRELMGDCEDCVEDDEFGGDEENEG